jgi:hypothetical protein
MRHQFTVNVSAGIIGYLLIGPYELPPRLSGTSDLHLLIEELRQILEDVCTLATRQTVWFMHVVLLLILPATLSSCWTLVTQIDG